jgi:hypothetical protein
MFAHLTFYFYQFSEDDLIENKLGRISSKQENYFKKTANFLLLFFLIIGVLLSAGCYFLGLLSLLSSMAVLSFMCLIGIVLRKKYQTTTKDSALEIIEGQIQVYTSQINFSSSQNNSGIKINNRRFVADIKLFEPGSYYRLYITKRYFLLSWEKIK